MTTDYAATSSVEPAGPCRGEEPETGERATEIAGGNSLDSDSKEEEEVVVGGGVAAFDVAWRTMVAGSKDPLSSMKASS